MSSHVPFDETCNRLRHVLGWLEMDRAQGLLTSEEKNRLYMAVNTMESRINAIMNRARKRGDDLRHAE